MKPVYTDFIKSNDQKYTSLIDEYRRIRYFKYNETFKVDSADELFKLLQDSFKHMFSIKRELVSGLKFEHKIKNTHATYTLEEIDPTKHYILLKWNVENDVYNLEFQIKKTSNEKKFRLKFRQYLKRDITFFGMADYAGVVLYKQSFKSNMKTFCAHIRYIQAGSLEKETKEFKTSVRIKNIDLEKSFLALCKGLKKFYKIKGNLSNGQIFNFTQDQKSLKYQITAFDEKQKTITISWENAEIQHEIKYSMIEDKLVSERKLTCGKGLLKIPGQIKLRTYKTLFSKFSKELAKDIEQSITK
ncbi:MAG: hypothetical protein ACRC42_03775 [Mycoplasma sp.]